MFLEFSQLVFTLKSMVALSMSELLKPVSVMFRYKYTRPAAGEGTGTEGAIRQEVCEKCPYPMRIPVLSIIIGCTSGLWPLRLIFRTERVRTNWVPRLS